MGSTKRALLVTLAFWASRAVAEEADGPREDEAAVVRRVSATLLGEALGGGLPLVLGYALLDPSTCNPFSGCSVAPFAIGASIAPFTFAAGATATHAAFGGRAGPGFGLAGALTGYVVGLSFLAFVSLAAKNPWSAKMAAPGAGLLAALTLAGGVIGLEWRHRSLLGGSRAWSAGRLALTTLAFWVPAFGLSFGLGYGVVALSYGAPGIVWPGLILGGMGVLFVSGLAGWAVHRGLGGRGHPAYLAAGLLASSAAAALFFFSHLWSPPTPKLFGGSDGSAFAPIIGITAAIAMAGPPIALEWNSALQEPERDEPKDPDAHVNVGLTPTPGGAVLGLGFRF